MEKRKRLPRLSKRSYLLERVGRTLICAPPAPDEKVVIEHTSVNPNKSMHIGHLRNSCIGDTLVRMLRRIGYTVEVHNYIDDLGNQLADTVVGLLNVPLSGEHVRFGDYCWDIYSAINREYAVNPEMAAKRAKRCMSWKKGRETSPGSGAWPPNGSFGNMWRR